MTGNLKNIWKQVPKVPFSALIVHIIITILWSTRIIPPPTWILTFLQTLYDQYGYLGLITATFLEGIVYLGLYFPGAFIIALAVFFSDGKFLTLLTISIVVAITFTATSFVNYFLGEHLNSKHKRDPSKEKFSKGLLVSILHPNLLALYFFNEGIKKRTPIKIFFVPLLMIPYGLVFAYMLYIFSDPIKSQLDNPFFIGFLILGWIIISFIIEYSKRNKELKQALSQWNSNK